MDPAECPDEFTDSVLGVEGFDGPDTYGVPVTPLGGRSEGIGVDTERE